eukprot:2345459-Amphidinium_carterae.1
MHSVGAADVFAERRFCSTYKTQKLWSLECCVVQSFANCVWALWSCSKGFLANYNSLLFSSSAHQLTRSHAVVLFVRAFCTTLCYTPFAHSATRTQTTPQLDQKDIEHIAFTADATSEITRATRRGCESPCDTCGKFVLSVSSVEIDKSNALTSCIYDASPNAPSDHKPEAAKRKDSGASPPRDPARFLCDGVVPAVFDVAGQCSPASQQQLSWLVQKHAQYLHALSWSRAASQSGSLYTHLSCALLKTEALLHGHGRWAQLYRSLLCHGSLDADRLAYSAHAA